MSYFADPLASWHITRDNLMISGRVPTTVKTLSFFTLLLLQDKYRDLRDQISR
jgi:hypothetical protein